MQRKINKIIEIPCENSSKPMIESCIREYLVDNKDYIDGNIVIKSDRNEAVDVVIFEGCENIAELTRILTM